MTSAGAVARLTLGRRSGRASGFGGFGRGRGGARCPFAAQQATSCHNGSGSDVRFLLRNISKAREATPAVEHNDRCTGPSDMALGLSALDARNTSFPARPGGCDDQWSPASEPCSGRVVVHKRKQRSCRLRTLLTIPVLRRPHVENSRHDLTSPTNAYIQVGVVALPRSSRTRPRE